MGKFTGVLLASDFDNTLLNTETARRSGSEVPEVSPENQAALRYFMEAGGRFAIATGRALAAFEKFADQVPMNSPGILCNGAALYDFRQHAYLDVILLDTDIRSRGKAVMDAFPSVAVEAYPLENVIHAVRPNLYTRQHEHVTHVAVQEDATLLETPYPLTKLMFEDDHDRLLEIQAHLARQSWCQEYEIFFSDRTLLEMTARGASKGGMVYRL
ncbi:MAG: HAD-IIB family hydrolase, partial [Oscillibacter sp.]